MSPDPNAQDGFFTADAGEFSPHLAHEPLLSAARPRLAFDPGRDWGQWRAELRQTLHRLLGQMPENVAPDLRVLRTIDREHYAERQFLFRAEPHADVPGHLLTPRGAPPAAGWPVMICLQGHSTGMHISLGRAKFEGDQAGIDGGRDLALQALRRGMAALVMEVRCFGLRQDGRPSGIQMGIAGCRHAAMAALLLGRTAIGERCWDIARAIDLVESGALGSLDARRIGITGNSGGGTLSYWAACLDERIAACMPSCYFCPMADSIGRIGHCECNYVPGALLEFDLPDLAGLIAPRPLVIVAGQRDEIFPVEAVRRGFRTVQRIYAAAGRADACRLCVGPEGHRYYPDLAWPALAELTGWITESR